MENRETFSDKKVTTCVRASTSVLCTSVNRQLQLLSTTTLRLEWHLFDAAFLICGFAFFHWLGPHSYRQVQLAYCCGTAAYKQKNLVYHLLIIALLSKDAVFDVTLMQTPMGFLLAGQELHSLLLELLGFLLFFYVHMIYFPIEVLQGIRTAALTELAFRVTFLVWSLYFTYHFIKKIALKINHQDLAFRTFGLLTGIRAMRVTDPDLIHTILREYIVKGDALERRVSLPSWHPIRSLESVDGEEWENMHRRLLKFMKLLPSAELLRDHLRRHLLMHHTASGGYEYTQMGGRSNGKRNLQSISLGEIDSIAISRITVAIFIEYLFGIPWAQEMEIFVTASLEWRKEIALRGRGDMKIKMLAVEMLLKLLRRSSYWGLFSEEWTKPGYYSIILQPFLISPAINVSDILVSLYAVPSGAPPKDVREMIMMAHPFPILERLVDDSRLAMAGIPANTHVFMFTSDMKPCSTFGAGKRVCSGISHAVAVLETFLEERSHYPFSPMKNHFYSGRDNDRNISMGEGLYFLSAVMYACLNWGRNKI